LDYEQYLDGIEHLKTRDQSLPPVVEQEVSRSIQQNLSDATTVARTLAELVAKLEEVDALEALLSSSTAKIEAGGMGRVLDEGSGVLEHWLKEHGLPSRTWRWAISHLRRNDLGGRVEAGSIVVSRGDRTIGVISASRRAEAEAALFVSRAYGLPPSFPRGAHDREQPFRLSASELVDMAMDVLVTFYRSRATRTALDGVQVLETGIPVLIVFLIIAVVLVAVGAVLTLLCSVGVITDKGTCAVAPYFILVGFLGIAAVFGAGKIYSSGSDNPDPTDDPDPYG
jgi:hypothetical protein